MWLNHFYNFTLSNVSQLFSWHLLCWTFHIVLATKKKLQYFSFMLVQEMWDKEHSNINET